MQPIRIKACSESDLRMLGNLARNIQRVLPVTQADIDAAAALGKGWVVWKVIEVNDPIDNLRGGTQLVIKQNSITPGQNVRRVLIVSGPGGETVVVGPGPSPLLLPDAIANSLAYVKAFGGTKQNGTPTPDAPMDIVSNNGVLKVRHQSGLPLGYQKVESLTFTPGAYIVTDIYPDQDTEFIVDVKKNTDNLTWFFGTRNYQSTTSPSENKYSLQGISTSSNSLWIQLDNTTRTEYNSVAVTSNLTERLARHTFGIKNKRIYMDGNAVAWGSYGAPNWSDFTALNPLVIGGNYQQAGDISGSFSGDLYGATGLILCKRLSDNVSGVYNPTTGNFFPADGTGTITAGNPVSDPVEIYTDGTVETIEDTIGNTATTEMLLKVGDYQDVQSILDGVVTRNVGVKVLDGTENWVTGTGGVWYNFQGDVGLFNTDAMICSHYSYAGADISIVDMSQNQFSSFANGNIAFKSAETTSAADFKTWLAAQYAAGTPVIVIYPLATEIGESVAGQTLQVTDGDNTVEITQASLSGLELEAKYTKAE